MDSAKDRAAGWLRDVFLPQGYPESVSSDYLHYQMWDTVQVYFMKFYLFYSYWQNPLYSNNIHVLPKMSAQLISKYTDGN